MGSHSAGPIPSVSHKPVFSSSGAVGPPKKVVLPEEACYTLFGDDAHNNSFFPWMILRVTINFMMILVYHIFVEV